MITFKQYFEGLADMAKTKKDVDDAYRHVRIVYADDLKRIIQKIADAHKLHLINVYQSSNPKKSDPKAVLFVVNVSFPEALTSKWYAEIGNGHNEEEMNVRWDAKVNKVLDEFGDDLDMMAHGMGDGGSAEPVGEHSDSFHVFVPRSVIKKRT